MPLTPLVLLWLATSGAHGPAPAALDVLAWAGTDDGCATTPDELVPSVVRTNLGLAAWGGPIDPFGYVCPSRWGGGTGAATAADADGQQILVALDGAVATSTDGGCTFAITETDPGDSVTAVTRFGGSFFVAVRRFDASPSGLIAVTPAGGVTEAGRWPENAPDGLAVVGESLWAAGATPSPWAASVQTGVLADPVELPLTDGLDRLTPRAAGGKLWLVAGAGDARTLWSVDSGEATPVLGPASILLGPVRVGELWWAALDGEAWSSSDGVTWSDATRVVGWTCLGELAARPFACVFTNVDVLTPGDGQPTQTRVFSLTQLDPPDLTRCDAVGSQCELDWYHYGGESGWVGTQGGVCPAEARQAAPSDDDETDDPTVACGCVSGPVGASWVGVLWLAWWVPRRRARVVASAR